MEKNEKDYITAYQNKGYKCSYQIKNGNIIDLKTKKEYEPKDISIVAEHRFEGMSDPSDMSILFVVESNNGDSKGTVLAGYGPSNDNEMALFFKKVPKNQYSNKANIIDFDKK